jgi:hypothetical protein
MANVDFSGDPTASVDKDSTVSGTFTADEYLYTSGPYIGELYIIDTTATDGQAMATSAYAKITQWQSAGLASNVTVSTANSNFTVLTSGYYRATAALSVSTTVVGTYELQLHAGDTTQDKFKQSFSYVAGSLDNKTVFINGYLQSTAGTTIDLRGISTTGAGTLLFNNGNFSVEKVG